MISTKTWLLEHLTDLAKCPTGYKQLQHFEKSVLPRIQTYKRNVEPELKYRSAPKT